MDSTTSTLIKKDILHDALLKCLNPSRFPENELVIFKSNLKFLLKQVWTILAANKCCETDSWLLHCRVGVIGLHFLSNTNAEFYSYMHYLCSLKNDDIELCIQELELKIPVETSDTFRVSVFYGLISILLIRKQLYTKEFRFVYEQIHIQCQQQTRHNQLYFQLLSMYVHNYCDHLTKEDYNNILDTVYYNLDKKDCSSLLIDISNKTEKTDASYILNTTLNCMSWKYKQKYILINDILSKYLSLLTSLPHEVCVKGLIFAQSKPYLSSAAAKLHNTIVKHIDGQIWIEKYYSAFEEIIIMPGQPTLCHRNILKYYMNQAFEASHRSNFENIIEKFLLENASVYTILNLTVMGIKCSLFKKDYDFNKIIDLGWNDTEDSIRNMSFDIICSIKDVVSLESYEYIQNFIFLNINEADQSSRVSIRKSYEKFIRKLDNAIIRLPTIDSHVAVVKHSSDFFNSLIPFLLKQFSRSSNYQRVSLSLTLLNVTLTYFTKKKVIENSTFLHKYRQYLRFVHVFCNINEYFPQFMNMLEICNIDESPKIIQTILSELNLDELIDTEISAMYELGLKNICNSNMEVAENGQKLIEFVHKLQTNERETKLNMLKEIMFQQWDQIKNSDSENIVENNALHPLITLIRTSINFYNTKEYEELLSFLEDVVSNLLNVFGLRAMLPFNSNYCTGVAKAFENESSRYHACTVNCMWLVLKATCKLAATIARILQTDIIMHRTLNLIYSIIQKCYHKGALEVAGETLSIIVSRATIDNYNLSVIDEFLNQIFERIPQTTEATSTVRRAAETRIMLSAIAINDKRMHKPFFHKTMDFLMRTLDSCLNDINPQLVAPVHALVLHCLQPIVMDNAVELHIVEYLSAIAIISLSSFESYDWKVRNAALQTFGAVTNKLLGTALSSNDDFSQHHATCLEEIFFKYPAIYHYIIARLCEAKLAPHKFLNVIIPILSFLSMSYARDDVLIDCTKVQMKQLSIHLLSFIDVAPNLQVFILAAKAYTSLCYHRNINGEILRLSYYIINKMDNNSYFSLMYSIKVLSDKVIEDASTLPNCDNIESNIIERLDIFSAMIAQRTTFYKVIFCVLLYRPGLKSIHPENMENNLKYLSSNPDITSKLPGIWDCVNNKLKLFFTFEKISSLINLIKVCLRENISINLKVMCLKTVKNRILHNEEAKKVCEQELISTLIEFLYNENYMRIRYVMDECINLLIHLDVSQINEKLKNKIIADVNSIKDKKIPNSYMPVFCNIYESLPYDQPNIRGFFEYSAEQCLQNLDKENPDPLILKALKFICKFAKKNSNNGIMVQNLKAVYKMLQRGDEDFTKECEDILAFCFEMKPKHAYANILELVYKENLMKLIGPYFAIQFLVQIYCEREDEETFGNSVFDQKNTLSIETDVLEDQIYEHIHYIFKNNLENQSEFIIWFAEYKKSKFNNKYVQNLIDMFE